jgi:hypothetical protein
VVGIVVLHVHFQTGSWYLAAEAAAGAVLIGGSVLIARAAALDVAACRQAARTWRHPAALRRPLPAPLHSPLHTPPHTAPPGDVPGSLPAAGVGGDAVSRLGQWRRWVGRLATGSRQPSG